MRRIGEDTDIALPDFGDIELPDIDLDLFDIFEGEGEETRYLKPRIEAMPSECVVYDNAVKLAKELRLDKGMRADALVGGNFIFGDFIEAYVIEHQAVCEKMTITTLSMNQNNVDSLQTLLDKGWVKRLNLLVSAYFYSMERHALIPYIYRHLDSGDRFQLAVGHMHTKTAQFQTRGGRKIVIHGSANLRSSACVEQFCIEENETLYDFYDERFSAIIEKYKTINHTVPNKALYDTLSRKKFND